MLPSVYHTVLAACSPPFLPKYQLRGEKGLKKIYSDIVKLNTQSPFYLLHLNEAKECFMLNIKGEAMALSALLQDMADPKQASSYFSPMKAHSENPDSAIVEIINPDKKLPEPFTLSVENLATAQKNSGNFVYPDSRILPPGEYRFQISVEENMYEFQFAITNKNTNHEIMTQLADFINQANIGLKASLSLDADQKTNLEIESLTTGRTSNTTFLLDDIQFPQSGQGLVDYFGLNQISTLPTNSSFFLNGIHKESMNNSFVMNQSLKVTLLNPSEKPFSISYKKDEEKIASTLDHFLDTYNTLMTSSKASAALKGDIDSITRKHYGKLTENGFVKEETGLLTSDKEVISQAIRNGAIEKLFSNNSFFSLDMRNRLDEVILNPIKYIDKVTVSYPNLSKPRLLSPYAASMYSGILFNLYL